MLRHCAVVLATTAVAFAQSHFPPPPFPAGNPPTAEKELLGMALFFEEQLSGNNQVACATCHDFLAGGVDSRAFDSFNVGADHLSGTADDQHGSPGVPMILLGTVVLPKFDGTFDAQVTGRRTPTVINSGYQPAFGYAGQHDTLEGVVEAPPLNTAEMGHFGRTWADVTQKLATSQPLRLASALPTRLANFVNGHTYPDLFQQAFGSPVIDRVRVSQAISTYLRTLNSDESNWDLHLAGQYTLTAQEQQGLTLFTSPASGATACNTCHGDFNTNVPQTGPIVGQMTMVSTGYYGSPTPTRLLFHNVGLRPPAEDTGRMGVTNALADNGRFRVQNLRNIELAGPYFHNGSAATLHDAIEFYNRGGDFHVNQAPSLTVRNYTPAEIDALVAILRTLTDPRVAAGQYPFDRPLLSHQNGRRTEAIGPPSVTATGELLATAPITPMVGDPRLVLTLSGATIGTPTFLMFDTQAATGSNPWNLQLALSPSFSMFTIGLAEWTPFVLNGYGTKKVDVPVPANPMLSGTTLFAQWLALEPSTTASFSLSNALRIYVN